MDDVIEPLGTDVADTGEQQTEITDLPVAEEPEEFVIEIEGEEAEEEPQLVKQLRSELRTTQRELAEHRKAAMPKIEVGPKPTLESCDFDEEKYEAEFDAWKERGIQSQAQEAKAAEQAETHNRNYASKLASYQARLAALPIPEAEKQSAESAVKSVLPDILQSALVFYATDPAKLLMALARHPAKLSALAQESDPVEFVIKIKDIERNLKVVSRKKPPAAEAGTIQRGDAPLTAGTDKKEAELLAKAERTGDMNEYRAYMREKRKAA